MRVLTTPDSVVTILFHDGCRSARLLRPTVRLVACCLCRRKGHLQSIRRHSAICPPVLVALVGETGQSARVRTQKGSETLTIVCRVEVTATIVCVKCVVSIVKIKGDYSR